MMATKLEECARALCAMCGGNPDQIWTDGKPEWTMWTYDVRAVIRCLMEPTREMCTAGASVDAVIGFSDDSEKVFRAMLQSVLDEGK